MQVSRQPESIFLLWECPWDSGKIRILENRRIMSSANWPTAVPIRKHELSEPSVSLMKMESMRFTDRQTRNEPSSVLLKQVFELT